MGSLRELLNPDVTTVQRPQMPMRATSLACSATTIALPSLLAIHRIGSALAVSVIIARHRANVQQRAGFAPAI